MKFAFGSARVSPSLQRSDTVHATGMEPLRHGNDDQGEKFENHIKLVCKLDSRTGQNAWPTEWQVCSRIQSHSTYVNSLSPLSIR